ncbi:hypothetical protein ACLB2K_011261 [Fragaria x ananassa]
MPCESLSSGESQPLSSNDNSQPIEVGIEPNEPDKEEVIRKRKRMSSVWDHFKLEKIDVSGGNIQMKGQKDDGSVGAFKYSHARMREGLAKLLAAEELPFSFAESPNFERFQREYCQPEFKKVPRNTNKNDLLKVYKEEKKRINLNGLELILSEIRKNLEITIPMTLTSIQKNFNDTYKLYAKKYADASVQSSQTSHRPSPSESNASNSQAVFGLLASKTKQRGIVSSCNEFFKYLDADFTEFMTEEEKVKLDILRWWKAYSRNFHVLSIMARDVLTIPVSTIALESAFSAGGRVVDEKRSRLTPRNLEALMLVKDWNDADRRAQTFVDEELACDEEENKGALTIHID